MYKPHRCAGKVKANDKSLFKLNFPTFTQDTYSKQAPQQGLGSCSANKAVWGCTGMYEAVCGCTMVVCWLHAGCMQFVQGLYTGCRWVVHMLYVGCMLVVHGLYVGCTWVVCGLYMGCKEMHTDGTYLALQYVC